MFVEGELSKGQILLNYLTPKAKVISKVIVHNIAPKMSSMHYLSLDHVKILYVLFDGTHFNWAKFFFDKIIKDHTSCLPYATLITNFFEAYKVVFSNEIDET